MLERWTELFGYYSTSRKGPGIFIRDLLPTLGRASFLSSFALFLPAAAGAGAAAHAGYNACSRSFGVNQTVRLWAKSDAARSFLLGKARCPALVPLVAPCPMPHAACPVAPRK